MFYQITVARPPGSVGKLVRVLHTDCRIHAEHVSRRLTRKWPVSCTINLTTEGYKALKAYADLLA